MKAGAGSLCLLESTSQSIECECSRVVLNYLYLKSLFFRVRIPVLVMKFYPSHSDVAVSPDQLWTVLNLANRN